VWAAQAQSQSKMATEVITLRQLKRDSGRFAKLLPRRRVKVAAEAPAPPVRDQDVWRTIGEAQKGDVTFSENTLQLMRSKQTLTDEVLDNLRRTVAADTAFNEYDLHRRVHNSESIDRSRGQRPAMRQVVQDEANLAGC